MMRMREQVSFMQIGDLGWTLVCDKNGSKNWIDTSHVAFLPRGELAPTGQSSARDHIPDPHAGIVPVQAHNYGLKAMFTHVLQPWEAARDDDKWGNNGWERARGNYPVTMMAGQAIVPTLVPQSALSSRSVYITSLPPLEISIHVCLRCCVFRSVWA